MNTDIVRHIISYLDHVKFRKEELVSIIPLSDQRFEMLQTMPKIQQVSSRCGRVFIPNQQSPRFVAQVFLTQPKGALSIQQFYQVSGSFHLVTRISMKIGKPKTVMTYYSTYQIN